MLSVVACLPGICNRVRGKMPACRGDLLAGDMQPCAEEMTACRPRSVGSPEDVASCDVKCMSGRDDERLFEVQKMLPHVM